MVAEAQHRKAPLEREADRYARYFLPVVEVVAVLTVAGRLPLPLAGHVVEGGRGAGRRLPVCPDPGHTRGGARGDGLAGPARHPHQRRRGAGATGEVRHLRLRQDRHADQRLVPNSPESCRWAIEPRTKSSPWPRSPSRAASTHSPAWSPESRPIGNSRLSIAFDVEATPGAGVSARYRLEAEPEDSTGHRILVGNRRLMDEGASLWNRPRSLSASWTPGAKHL